MPIFEYKCRKCSFEFEALVRNADSLPEEGCPECGSKELQKLLSTFAARVPQGSGACPMQGSCPAVSHPTGGGCCCSGKCHGH